MTREAKIKIIRAACVAANPEIMELKFGCRYIDGERNITIVNAQVVRRTLIQQEQLQRSSWFASVVGTDGERMLEGVIEGSDVQVLGRPIRLADVLFAIPRNYFVRGAEGEFIQAFYNHTHEKLGIFWNLRKDDLTEQSDECLQFLTDLLASK